VYHQIVGQVGGINWHPFLEKGYRRFRFLNCIHKKNAAQTRKEAQ